MVSFPWHIIPGIRGQQVECNSQPETTTTINIKISSGSKDDFVTFFCFESIHVVSSSSPISLCPLSFLLLRDFLLLHKLIRVSPENVQNHCRSKNSNYSSAVTKLCTRFQNLPLPHGSLHQQIPIPKTSNFKPTSRLRSGD